MKIKTAQRMLTLAVVTLLLTIAANIISLTIKTAHAEYENYPAWTRDDVREVKEYLKEIAEK